MFQVAIPFIKILRSSGKEGVCDINRNFVAYEDALTNTFFAGAQPGMIDYMLWPWFERLPLLNDAGYCFNCDGRFPRLASWIQAMEANEHVQRIKVPIESTKKFMDGFRQGKPDYDLV